MHNLIIFRESKNLNTDVIDIVIGPFNSAGEAVGHIDKIRENLDELHGSNGWAFGVEKIHSVKEAENVFVQRRIRKATSNDPKIT